MTTAETSATPKVRIGWCDRCQRPIHRGEGPVLCTTCASLRKTMLDVGPLVKSIAWIIYKATHLDYRSLHWTGAHSVLDYDAKHGTSLVYLETMTEAQLRDFATRHRIKL